MDILPINFKVLHFCGAWTEHKDDRAIVRLMSIFYRYAVAALVFYFTFMEVITLVFTFDDLEDVTESLFLSLTYVCLCLKFVNFLVRQEELTTLLNSFRSEICQPRDFTEKKILAKYDQKAKWSALIFMGIAHTNALMQIVTPVLSMNLSKRNLPVKTYIPYSISGLNTYIATYLVHVVCIVISVTLNVSFDSLMYGLMLRVCGQINVHSYRCTVNLKNVYANEINHRTTTNSMSIALRDCVKHRVLIQDLVKRIRSLFLWTACALFFFSLIIFCTSIFQMSKKNLFTLEFLILFIYIIAVTYQIFFYCWYGNELQLKSKTVADVIYSTDWTMLSPQERRSLNILMMFSQKELIISYHRIFALDLKAFTWIMKTSYSAFNILQQIAE